MVFPSPVVIQGVIFLLAGIIFVPTLIIIQQFLSQWKCDSLSSTFLAIF